MLRLLKEADHEPKNRFEAKNKKLRANFNSDLIKVAADKVHQLEIASIESSDTLLSNGEKVERLLRSFEKRRLVD